MNRRQMYTKAYELAYLTMMDARIARSIAKIAFGRLDAALDQQYRRSYYRLRKVRATELRDVDIVDPHGLCLEVLHTEGPLTRHLRQKFLKRDVIRAVDTFSNTNSERLFLRERLARDLNEAIFFANLSDQVDQRAKEQSVSSIQTRASKQLINRQIIQQAFGRYLAANQHRNAVNLSDLQMLQVLVYAAAEPYELDAEASGASSYEDLCVRYIKYLAKLSFKSNVFHTSVAYGSLIYDFGRTGAAKIHDYAVQDVSRSRPKSNYSNSKAAVMHLLENERFAANYRLVREEAIGAPTRYKWRQSSDNELSRLLVWLKRLAFWLKCVGVAEEPNSPSDEGFRELLVFTGVDPDDEHPVERRRIHGISCPECFTLFAAYAGLQNPRNRLGLPYFEATIDMKNDDDENARLQPPKIKAEDINDDLKEIDGIRALRRVSTTSPLSVRVDGVECAKLIPPNTVTASFGFMGSPDLIEIWGTSQGLERREILLAAHLLGGSLDGQRMEVVSLQIPTGNLHVELTHSPQGLSVDILLRNTRAFTLESRENIKCLDDLRLATLALDQALSSGAEEEHIQHCNRCYRHLHRLDLQVHPTLATLLAFASGRLRADSNARVESHLQDGCRKCGASLRARCFNAIASALSTHEARYQQLREFLRYSLDGVDHFPVSAAQYSGPNYETPQSYFGYFARGEIIVTIEETDECELLITVASPKLQLDGRRYAVELIGEQDAFLSEILLEKEGDYYEGSSYLQLSETSLSRLRSFTIFGALLFSDSKIDSDSKAVGDLGALEN
jgi:hypothetical protein